jgi:hypothetical protein
MSISFLDLFSWSKRPQCGLIPGQKYNNQDIHQHLPLESPVETIAIPTIPPGHQDTGTIP